MLLLLFDEAKYFCFFNYDTAIICLKDGLELSGSNLQCSQVTIQLFIL